MPHRHSAAESDGGVVRIVQRGLEEHRARGAVNLELQDTELQEMVEELLRPKLHEALFMEDHQAEHRVLRSSTRGRVRPPR